LAASKDIGVLIRHDTSIGEQILVKSNWFFLKIICWSNLVLNLFLSRKQLLAFIKFWEIKPGFIRIKYSATLLHWLQNWKLAATLIHL
jgi:hypothetical protein